MTLKTKFPTFSVLLLLLFLSASIGSLKAQSVPRQAIVEHFTNSWCSVCASQNPGFYTNLRNFPQYIHISYFPSSPYRGCQINLMNTAQNDAVTNYYSIYG